MADIAWSDLFALTLSQLDEPVNIKPPTPSEVAQVPAPDARAAQAGQLSAKIRAPGWTVMF